jgi:hypothetical protein
MEKKRYYVSVQAETLMEHQGDAAYEFEIDATPEDVQQLHELFESESEADFQNYLRIHNPKILEEELVSHAMFDQHLTEVYRLIHQLGTPETQAHIQSMNVLQGIQSGYRSDN